jgi:hypothetical protein
VEIELVPADDGTLIRLTHHDLPAAERPTHLIGWQHYLPRLATVSVGDEPGPDSGP